MQALLPVTDDRMVFLLRHSLCIRQLLKDLYTAMGGLLCRFIDCETIDGVLFSGCSPDALLTVTVMSLPCCSTCLRWWEVSTGASAFCSCILQNL